MNSLVWIAGPSPAHMVIRNRLMRVNSVAVGRQTSHSVARCARLNAGKSCFGAQCGFKSVTEGHTFTVWILQKDNTETILNDTNIYSISVICAKWQRDVCWKAVEEFSSCRQKKQDEHQLRTYGRFGVNIKKKKGRDIWCITSHSLSRHTTASPARCFLFPSCFETNEISKRTNGYNFHM